MGRGPRVPLAVTVGRNRLPRVVDAMQLDAALPAHVIIIRDWDEHMISQFHETGNSTRSCPGTYLAARGRAGEDFTIFFKKLVSSVRIGHTSANIRRS